MYDLLSPQREYKAVTGSTRTHSLSILNSLQSCIEDKLSICTRIDPDLSAGQVVKPPLSQCSITFQIL